jgi:hypothetical protein
MTGLRAAVDASLDAIEIDPKDQGAAELARQLASAIDAAEKAERWASRALVAFDEDPDNHDMPDLEEMIKALKAKVSHRDALVRVGQRLEAVLVQLQATPGSRGKAATPPSRTLGGPLSLLRGGAG